MDFELIRAGYAFSGMYTHRLVADIPEERMCEQPVTAEGGKVVNHAAWQLGHLACVHDNMLRLLGGTPKLEAWKEKFGMGSRPVEDRGAYPSKAALLMAFDDANKRLWEAVTAASEEVGQAATPERIRGIFPTVRDMLAGLMTGHFGNHMGQLSAWRRAIGLGSVS